MVIPAQNSAKNLRQNSTKSDRARGRMGGRPKGLSPRYQEIAPMVISAYKEQRSIRDIMKAFSIPSTTTVYKILTDNNVPFQVYKKPTL